MGEGNPRCLTAVPLNPAFAIPCPLDVEVPQGQHRIAGRDIRLANGSLSVRARRLGGQLRTTADVGLRGVRVTIGHVLLPGARGAGFGRTVSR
jgi:hypothetical protein